MDSHTISPSQACTKVPISITNQPQSLGHVRSHATHLEQMLEDHMIAESRRVLQSDYERNPVGRDIQRANRTASRTEASSSTSSTPKTTPITTSITTSTASRTCTKRHDGGGREFVRKCSTVRSGIPYKYSCLAEK